MSFKSQAQRRFMFAAEARGEVPKGTARRWQRETGKGKKLPEKVASLSWRLGVMEKMAEAMASRPISMAHGAKRLAQQALALKNRVTRKTPHLSNLPSGDRFRAFALENPGVVERSKKLHKTIASTSGLSSARAVKTSSFEAGVKNAFFHAKNL